MTIPKRIPNHLLYTIAVDYYLSGATQEEIGEKYGISRPQISRYLRKAREEKIVEITVHPPTEIDQVALERGLEQKYGLKKAVVVPFLRRKYPPEELIRTIAISAAKTVKKLISIHQRIGIGWGKTVYQTVLAICSDRSGERPKPLMKRELAFYPLIGGLRSSAQLISYEIALGMAVIPLFLIAGGLEAPAASAGWQKLLAGTSSLNLGRLVSWQALHGWFILYAPVSFVICLAAMFAETNRMPFDLPESEQELAGGYNVEYSSMKFALFFMGEYANMVAAAALMTTLFLGGWSLPVAGLNQPAATIGAGLLHIGIFLAKMCFLIFMVIWVRWMWPRFRYDQLMDLGWRRFIPLALANIVVTAAVLWIRS